MGSGEQTPEPTVSVEFEVFGKVQGIFILFQKKSFINFYYTKIITGVYFTKYSHEMCDQLGLSGWVKNTKKGTIIGKIQGNRSNIEHM